MNEIPVESPEDEPLGERISKGTTIADITAGNDETDKEVDHLEVSIVLEAKAHYKAMDTTCHISSDVPGPFWQRKPRIASDLSVIPAAPPRRKSHGGCPALALNC